MIPESLTIVERQVLANQFRILSKLEADEDNVEDYDIKIEILENGFTEKYYEVFDVNTDEVTLEVCEETSQTLNMYRRINKAIELLTDEEKKELDLDKIKFKGFDPNNDAHYHYMYFMVNRMNLWREYRGQILESNCEFQLAKYQKMLEYQNFLLENDQYHLRKEDLEQLIDIVTKDRKIISIQAYH